MTPPRKQLALPSPEQWAQSQGLQLATKAFKALFEQRAQVGEENYRLAFSMFLSGMIASFLNVGLMQRPKDEALYSQEELSKFAEQNFTDMKALLQTSVANGVQSGILSWSGMEIEYYCLIKPTPDPINIKPC